GQIDHRACERFVEREIRVPRARNACAVAERLRDAVPDCDAAVLDRVVLIDVKITRTRKPQIERPVLRERAEHVIEKPYSRADFPLARPVEHEAHVDVRLLRRAPVLRDAWLQLAHVSSLRSRAGSARSTPSSPGATTSAPARHASSICFWS